MVRLKVDKFLSEEFRFLNDTTISNKRILINAPMKCGKTHYITKVLAPYLAKSGVWVIYISPTVTLLDQVFKRNKGSRFARAGLVKNLPVNPVLLISTPDSSYKFIDQLEKRKEKYLIVYDEIHCSFTDYSFRKKMILPYKHLENEYCTGLVGITATADNLIDFMEWDEVIVVEPKEKFFQAEKFFVIKGEDMSIEDKINYIVQKYLENPKISIFVRVNNKREIKEIAEILKEVLSENAPIFTWFAKERGKITDEDLKKSYDMLEKATDECGTLEGIFLTTKLLDVGVEIWATNKPILIVFANWDSNVIDLIQFAGRFRNGSKEVHCFLRNNNKVARRCRSLMEIKKSLEKKAKIEWEFYMNEKILDKYFTSHWCLNRVKGEIEGNYTFVIDKYKLANYIFAEFIQEIMQFPEVFKTYLTEHPTFNVGTIEVVELGEAIPKDKEVREMLTAMEAQKTEKREKLQEIREGIYKFVDSVSDEFLVNCFLVSPKETPKEEVTGVELATIGWKEWHSEEFKEERSKMWWAWNIVKNDPKYARRCIKASIDGRIEELKEIEEYILANKRYDLGIKVVEEDLYTNVDYVRLCAIRNIVGETRMRISDENLGKVRQELREHFNIRMTKKGVGREIEKIYNVGRSERISSVKNKEKLDKIIEEWDE